MTNQLRKLLATAALVFSVTSANALDMDKVEGGVAGMVFYAAKCDSNDLSDQAIMFTLAYLKNNRRAIEARVEGLKKDFDNKSGIETWCRLMKPTILTTMR